MHIFNSDLFISLNWDVGLIEYFFSALTMHDNNCFEFKAEKNTHL